MRYCENCGYELSPTANFCPNCGHKINKTKIESGVAVAPSNEIPRVETPVARTEMPAPRAETPVARTEAPVPRAETPVARLETPVSRPETSVFRPETPSPRVIESSPEINNKPVDSFELMDEINNKKKPSNKNNKLVLIIATATVLVLIVVLVVVFILSGNESSNDVGNNTSSNVSESSLAETESSTDEESSTESPVSSESDTSSQSESSTEESSTVEIDFVAPGFGKVATKAVDTIEDPSNWYGVMTISDYSGDRPELEEEYEVWGFVNNSDGTYFSLYVDGLYGGDYPVVSFYIELEDTSFTPIIDDQAWVMDAIMSDGDEETFKPVLENGVLSATYSYENDGESFTLTYEIAHTDENA